MDQFVTTYRKNYLWPYVNVLGVKPVPEFSPEKGKVPCECNKLQESKTPGALKEQSWSRQGPMGMLLDPKLYPARVGPAGESDVMRHNQPNVFLNKLQEKYPYLYEILRTAPPDDIITRINKDRLRTTYQVDYCQMKEYPSAPYDELFEAASVQGALGKQSKDHECLKKIAFRPPLISKIPRAEGGGCSSQRKAQPSGIPNATAGFTEYMDTVSKVGQTIIREKIHHKEKTK